MTLMSCRILIAVVGSSAFVSGADSDSLVVMDMIVGERYVHSTALSYDAQTREIVYRPRRPNHLCTSHSLEVPVRRADRHQEHGTL